MLWLLTATAMVSSPDLAALKTLHKWFQQLMQRCWKKRVSEPLNCDPTRNLQHKNLSHFCDFWFGEYEINQTVQVFLKYMKANLALGIHYTYIHTYSAYIGFIQYMLH